MDDDLGAGNDEVCGVSAFYDYMPLTVSPLLLIPFPCSFFLLVLYCTSYNSFIMRSLLPLTILSLAVNAAPSLPDVTKGFETPIWSTTSGGAGNCITGNILVTVTALNSIINYDTPKNQSVVTETILELMRKSSESHPPNTSSTALVPFHINSC